MILKGTATKIWEDAEVNCRYEVRMTGIDKNSLMETIVVSGETILRVNQTESGWWECFVNDSCDPRRKLSFHPAQWIQSAGHRTANGWELVNFPIYLGKHAYLTYPAIQTIFDWFEKLKEVNLFRPKSQKAYGVPYTYADVLEPWLKGKLSDDDWLEINKFNWERMSEPAH